MTRYWPRLGAAVSLMFLGSVFLSGCSGSVGEFFDRRYQNVTGYFNTYYNAKRAFDEAEVEVHKDRAKAQVANYFAPYTPSQSAKQKFPSVIEKSSRLIQFYPNSKWVDRAVLMIGKSYYYQNELLPARRKFSELLEIYPRSHLRFEAKLGLAKVHYATQLHTDVLEVLRSLIPEALAEKEYDLAVEALLLRGQVFLDRDELSEAELSYLEALRIDGSERLRAYAQYQLAKTHERAGKIEAAVAAYQRVRDFGADFAIEYNARLRAGILFGQLGHYDDAFDMFDQLQREPLLAEQRALVDLETANILHMSDDYAAALIQYHLVDSLYQRTDAAARSYYQRGLLYESKLRDFEEAKRYYDLALSEYAQSEIIPIALKKSQVLGRYATHKSELVRFDSLLHRALNPPDTTVAEDSSSVSRDSEIAGERVGERTESDSPGSVAEATRRTDTTKSAPTVAIPLDTIHAKRASNQFSLGVLFLVDLEMPDSAEYWLTTLLDEYPQSSIAPRALYALAELYRLGDKPSKVDSVHNELLLRYPDSEYAAHVRKVSETTSHSEHNHASDSLYRRAEQYILEGDTRAAIRVLNKIVGKHKDSAAAPKARYTLGWIYENLQINNDSAIAHYRQLVEDHPNSVYASRVRPKLVMVDDVQAQEKAGQAPEQLSSSPGRVSIEKTEAARTESEIPQPKKEEPPPPKSERSEEEDGPKRR